MKPLPPVTSSFNRLAPRHVPYVGLARVQVERLDRPGAELAVIDLSQREARECRGPPVTEPRQLGQRPSVIGKPLELDELDAVDGRSGPIGLHVEGALRLRGEFHRRRLDLTAPTRPGATGTARRSCPSSAWRRPRRRL